MEQSTLMDLSKDVLLKLRIYFPQRDYDGLSADAFVTAMRCVLGTTATNGCSKRDLLRLFMRVDANSDGKVSWDDLITFIMTADKKAGEDTSDRDFGTTVCIKPVTTLRPSIGIENKFQYKHMISSLAIFGKRDQIVTASHDGSMRFFSSDTMRHERTVHVTSAWINDICYMPLSEKFAACSMDRVLTFVNTTTFECCDRIRMVHGPALKHSPVPSQTTRETLNTKNDISTIQFLSKLPNQNRSIGSLLSSTGTNVVAHHQRHDPQRLMQSRRSLKQFTPMCMDIAVMTPEIELLITGDDVGALHFFSFKNPQQWHCCDGRPGIACRCESTQPSWSHDVSRSTLRSLHSDWITKVRYVSAVESFFTASLDGTIKQFDINRTDIQSGVKQTFHGGKGLYSVDYSTKWRLLAGGGLGRNLFVYDSFSRHKQLLTGHSSAVQNVAFDDDRNLLISMSIDKTIKVFDVRVSNSIRCLQTIVDREHHRPENRFSTLLIDSGRARFITASSRLHIFNIQATNLTGLTTHKKPVVAALYNHDFDQVVSIDEGGDVFVFNVETGKCVFAFATNQTTSAASFDDKQRRLILGTQNGSVSLWNFNNGSRLSNLVYHGNAHTQKQEITCVQYIQASKLDSRAKYIAAGGWSSRISLWLDGDGDTQYAFSSMPNSSSLLQHTDIKGHHGDIHCMVLCENKEQVLATGGYDGAIIIWRYDHACAIAKLLPPDFIPKPDESNAVEQLVWLPTLRTLASCGGDCYIRLWCIRDSRMLLAMRTDDRHSLCAMTYCNERMLLLTGDSVGLVRVWSIATLTISDGDDGRRRVQSGTIALQHTFHTHSAAIKSLTMVSNGHFIVSAGADGSVRLWTLEGLQVGQFSRHADEWNFDDPKTWIGVQERKAEEQLSQWRARQETARTERRLSKSLIGFNNGMITQRSSLLRFKNPFIGIPEAVALEHKTSIVNHKNVHLNPTATKVHSEKIVPALDLSLVPTTDFDITGASPNDALSDDSCSDKQDDDWSDAYATRRFRGFNVGSVVIKGGSDSYRRNEAVTKVQKEQPTTQRTPFYSKSQYLFTESSTDDEDGSTAHQRGNNLSVFALRQRIPNDQLVIAQCMRKRLDGAIAGVGAPALNAAVSESTRKLYDLSPCAPPRIHKRQLNIITNTANHFSDDDT